MRVRTPFGTVPGAGEAAIVTLANASGMTVDILNYGATIHAVRVPDRDGVFADVALGHKSIEGYIAGSEYFGASVGRVANRIAGGRFTLDGVMHQLPLNDGANSLHGGTTGFNKRLWTIRIASAERVVLHLVNPDGDQGFPGTLDVTATHALDDENRLSVTYEAKTDRPTIVNLTNHSYWNLAGEGSGSALDHRLMIAADQFLPTDAGLIPTGEVRPVAGTAFDFRDATPIGVRIREGSDEQLRIGRGYDHNWVVGDGVATAPRRVARAEDPQSGRTLDLWSDQPGLQFYSG
ncbi:MAG: hypothetical protein RIS17_1955, partial [Pseudomonadota bacterium]